MNDECLKLKDHTAGYQTVEDIQRVVTEAIGGRTALMNERLIDEVMVSQLPVVANVCTARKCQMSLFNRLPHGMHICMHA